MNMRASNLIATLLAAAVMALPTALTAQNGSAPVVVSIATERLLAPVTAYPGTVISRNQARLAAEVEGRLEWVAEVGSAVRMGETVARLDDVLLEQTIRAEQAVVTREQARLVYQAAEVKRLAALVRRNSVPQSELDQAIANREMTEAEIAASEARVALTRERLARTELRAPFDGVVTERLLERGEWAESGAAIVRLVDTSLLEVQTWIPLNALKHVQVGSKLALSSNPSSAVEIGRAHV